MVQRTFIAGDEKYTWDGEPISRESRSHSRAVVVEDGNGPKTMYLCGVTNRDTDGQPVTSDFESGARACLNRLKDTVEAAGGSLADVVTMTVYITDPRWGDDFVRIRAEYFEAGKYPASALITVPALADPRLRIEIQAIAEA